MNPNTVSIILQVTTLLGVVLVAQYTAGRLHGRLSPNEATNLKLEFSIITAVIVYLLLQALIAAALELPAAEAFDVATADLLNPRPPPPA